MQREPRLDIDHLAFQLGQLFVHPCEPEARRLLCNTSTNNQRGNACSLAGRVPKKHGKRFIFNAVQKVNVDGQRTEAAHAVGALGNPLLYHRDKVLFIPRVLCAHENGVAANSNASKRVLGGGGQ